MTGRQAATSRVTVAPTATGPRAGRTAVVIGGGLAGIAAAIGLREAGFGVTVLEARPRLGGAASSFRRADLTIDNGQHVFLRCCTSYQDLLGRLGVAGSVTVQDRFDVTVLSPRRQARLRRSGAPSPLHLGRALAGYRLLSLRERLLVARAAAAFRSVDPGDASLDNVRLGDWLSARGQSERARRMLWDLFVVSSLNIAGDDASLPLAATVVKLALLGDRGAADIGMAAVPLGDLHDRAAARYLAGLGAQVRLGAKATAVERLAGGGFRVGELLADGVVLAVPPDQAAKLASPAGLAGTERWAGLGASPIVNVHIVYDRPVTGLPMAAGVNSPVQWVFDKTRQAGLASGQYLAVSLSAADEYVDVPVSALREVFEPAIEQLLPGASRARIVDFFVTRERRATFRQGPGTGALRPGTQTSVPGLVLAGAWTDTGWPDTMEGAVRSGDNAARELIRELAAGQDRPEALTQLGAAS
ncbi:MAG TPA: hydroxysqualene dehydroxylase HpnE [Streptosporangiaceae bacterium]|nr:hydroxysqualene dehydroxylase HpnE [Streptosporangiaceae bacterium]